MRETASRSRGSAMLMRASKYYTHRAASATPTSAATIRGLQSSLQLRLLFEGGYYSGCGYYLSKYGM